LRGCSIERLAKTDWWFQMIDRSNLAPIFLASLAGASLLIASPALSQAPTDAQRAAIRSECRSDYEAHCAGIPPGGLESLQCLQKNMSSLSSPCQSAVRAVEASPETKAEPPPASEPKAVTAPVTAPAAAPKAAGSTPRQPSSAQISAVRSACRSDYPKVCAGVPTGGAAALQCLEKNKSKVSAGCQRAVAAVSGDAAAPAVGGAAVEAAPAAEPPPTLVLRPMLPREELFVLRSACGPDVRALCAGVQPGGGRIVRCLAVQSASLSPACRNVLGQFAAQ
jgi:hypothetical protein